MVNRGIIFNSCAIIDEAIFFQALNDDFRCLMKVDIVSGEKSIFFPIVKGGERLNRVASNTIYVGGRVYWVNGDYKTLIEYDMSRNVIEYYDLPGIVVKDYEGISDIYYYDGRIYIIPLYTTAWIIFDLITRNVYTKKLGYLDVALFKKYRCTCQNGRFIYLFGFCGNNILKICVENLSVIDSIKVDYDAEMLDIKYLNSIIYLLGDHGEVYVVNSNNQELLLTPSDRDYVRMEVLNNNIIVLLPCFQDEINILDISTGYIDTIEYPKDFEYYESDVSKFLKFNSSGKYGCFGNRRANYTLIYDYVNSEFKWLSVLVDLNDEKKFILGNKKHPFKEGIITVDRFVENI